MFGSWMHPRSLVHVAALEVGVCDGKAIFRAESATENRYFHVVDNMMTNDTTPYIVVVVLPQSLEDDPQKRKSCAQKADELYIIIIMRDFSVLLLRKAQSTEHPSRSCPHLVLILQLSRLKQCG